ncbi:putative RNA-directed DNA polymerase from transposon X-element [Trichonephila clavipes]|nr:putative RNA-directed DNA polymerase from transposon X-element [Trichonephila clavipes]
MQDQGVPQGSVLSVTLFNIHMSSILDHLPPSVRGMLYVDDLQVSCQGSDITSPVTSLYVVCHQPPLELRRRQLSAKYFIRAVSVPSYPLKPFALAIGLNRLYEARSFNVKPFSEKAKAVLNDAHLSKINIQENNILAFPPWDIQIFNYSNPFSGYDKAGTANVIYQQLFSFHRSKFSKYIPVYTDGSKTAGHVGCDVVYNNTILNFTLHNSMSVFSAELTAILVALQHIIVSNHRHFCVYTDSMSALESLHFLTERRHPTVMEILILLRKLERKDFHIIFPWYLNTWDYVHHIWQETWDQQILNKLHSIHPSTSHWAALPERRYDVRLTRLRIGHTRFTHRHLLLDLSIPPRRNKEKLQQLTEFERGRIIGFREGGFSYYAVGARVQWNSSPLMQVWKQWTDEHRTTRKSGSGRRKVMSARDD